MFLAMFGMFLDLLNHLADILNSDDDWQLDQDTEIDIPETTSEIAPDDESSTFPEQDWPIHHDTSGSEHILFGGSPEVQHYEDSLSHAKFEVDSDRMLLNKEEREVDSIHSRLITSSDQINHEPNEDFVHIYQSEMSSVETELISHQQKLEQARADLAAHQEAEYDAEDKLREALNKGD